MDEPFGALDPPGRAEMQDMLRALLERMKTTVVLVTHDLDEALYLASRVVMIDEGRIVADLPSSEFSQSEIPEVQHYVRASRRSVALREDGARS
jgi:osmoprotectant transport system ATP-binding protein